MKHLHIHGFCAGCLLLSILCCAGCKHQGQKIEYENHISFPETSYIPLQTLNDTLLISFPRQIEVADSLLILLDWVNSCFCHIYNTRGEFVTEFVGKGQGPGEVLSANKFHLSSDGKTIYVYDMASWKIVAYDLASVLQGKKVFKEYKIDHSLFSQVGTPVTIYDALPLDSSFFLLKCNSYAIRYGIYSVATGEVTASYKDFLPLETTSSAIKKEHVWCILGGYTSSVYHPRSHTFFNATYIGAIMEKFKIAQDYSHIEAAGERYIYKPIYKVVEGTTPVFVTHDEHTLFGFDDIYFTDKGLYALLWDYEGQESLTGVSVFDADLNTIRRINTSKPLCRLCVDEQRGKIYVIAENEENEYELSVIHLDAGGGED